MKTAVTSLICAFFVAGCNGGDGDALAADASTDSTAIDSSSDSDGAAMHDAPADAGDERALPGWSLAWADEFEGADGTGADPKHWVHEVGGGGWGNQEREFYTDGTENAVQKGGMLVITATDADASARNCWYGPCRYTSARLITKTKFAQAYGRFEARIKIPYGQGIWPAFWLLGADIDQVGWPSCGEIDIMENIGREPATNHGSLHAPGFDTGSAYAIDAGKLADDFHVYTLEWEPGAIRFYVDGHLYETRTPAEVPDSGKWPFDHPFFVLLNVAVGGSWPGDPDNTTTFPQTMQVDWVRAYTKT